MSEILDGLGEYFAGPPVPKQDGDLEIRHHRTIDAVKVDRLQTIYWDAKCSCGWNPKWWYPTRKKAKEAHYIHVNTL